MGQLKNKSLGPNIGGATAALNSYDYNIRSCLLSINKDFFVQKANPTGKWFGLKLIYNKSSINRTFSELNYNVNIAGQVWKAKGDGETLNTAAEYLSTYPFSFDDEALIGTK